GGNINLVTKRAGDEPLTRVTGTYMGQSQFGTHLDVGRRFGTDNQWGVRANGVWRNGEGNIDGGRQRLGLGSLGLDFAGDKLRWSLDALATDGKTTEFRPQVGFRSGITSVPAVPDPRLNFYPGTELTDKAKTVISRLEYDLNDSTTIYGGVGYTHSKTFQHFPGAWGTEPDSQGNFSVSNGLYDEYNKTTSADAGLRTRFKTGSVGHTLVLSANHMARETGYFYTSTGSTPSNLYNPSPLPAITTPRLAPSKTADLTQQSVAIADTMAFADNRVLLTLGLRDQTINQKSVNGSTAYKASAITPLAGLVFKATRDTSVYTNYTAGLQAGGIAGVGTLNEGQVFAPQKTKQIEIGVKKDWGMLMTQAALFQITQPSSVTENQVYSFGGEQRNRGLELTTYGELQRGLRLMASAAFLDAKLTRTNNAANQGNDANGVPKRTFNVG
ncbi:MAG: TonB-dependent receptor, partial [Comamonas sp.]